MATAKHKIVIVDDHPLFRDGLFQLINRQKEMVCCGSTGNSADAVELIEREKAELVVLDLRLGEEDGLQVIRTMKTRFPELKVLVLSQFSETTYGERALRAGANGYVMKEEASEHVLDAIRTVLRGDIYASRSLAFAALRKVIFDKPGNAAVGPDRLSDRELQVFEMIGNGMSVKIIAEKLVLSPKTVETYRENIKNKLGLASAAELSRTAVAWVENSAVGKKG